MTPWKRLLVLLVVATPLAGCSGLRLYSETRDKQGQTAVKAWAAVNLNADFESHAVQRKAQLARELATADKRLASERELAVRHLASAPAADLPAFVSDEFERLLGAKLADGAPSIEAVKQLEAGADLHRAKRGELARSLSFLQERNAPAFTCQQLIGASDGAVKAWQQRETRANDFVGKKNLKEAQIVCAELDRLRVARTELLKNFTRGELGETQQSLREAEEKVRTLQDQALEQKLVYDKAASAYEELLAQAAAGNASQESVAQAAKKLGAAIEALQNLQTAFGDAIVSQVRIDQVNAVIDKLTVGKALGADATKAQIVITTLPVLADDIRAIRNADKSGSLVSILMWRDLEQSRLQAAKAQVLMQETELELLRSTIEAQLAQAQALLRSHDELRQVPALALSTAPLHQTWQTIGGGKARVALFSALDSCLDAIGRLRQASERLRRTRFALSLEKSAALSEVNAGIWASLIAESINQAAEFSASGVKASNFANFISALGVLGIANGTNK